MSTRRQAQGRQRKSKPIRVGVIGVGRGKSFASAATEAVGMKLVALCDTWEEKLKEAGKRYDVATYADYDRFLAHDMDAVVLAHYFHEHAPFAIKVLEAGKHVMSETAACKTLAEGVALCRAVEQSGKIYMFAENYPYSLSCQEMTRLYQSGRIGDVRYAEGQYNHPSDKEWRLSIVPNLNHWRNWMPSTYYCSHALAPLMMATDTMPVSVNALSIVEEGNASPNTTKLSDSGFVTLARMENGAVFRLLGLTLSSKHMAQYDLHGDRGYLRAQGSQVHIHHEPWLVPEGEPSDMTYTPAWPTHGELAAKAGHGGGDFFMNLHFAEAIRSGRQPYLDVYRGVTMAAVGILGWRSCLANGQCQAIPDFRDKKARRAFENDHASPFPEDAGPGQPAPSIRGIVKPSAKTMRHARSVWAKLGY